MKKYKILILSFAISLVALVSSVFGSTLSRDVVENMSYLQKLISKPSSERFIDVESQEYNLFMDILEGKRRNNSSVGAKALACLYFAWADDESSRERLEYYAEADILSGLPSFVGGAALYALTMRDLRERSFDEKELLLSYTLGSVDNDFQKLFIANRLWVDYGEKVLPVILLTASMKSDKFVMQEYLYYLTKATDHSILKEAVNMDWPAGIEIYDWSCVMSAVTPGRPADFFKHSPTFSIRKIRSRLEEINNGDF